MTYTPYFQSQNRIYSAFTFSVKSHLARFCYRFVRFLRVAHPFISNGRKSALVEYRDPKASTLPLTERDITTVNTPTRNQFGATVIQAMTYISQLRIGD